MYYITLLYYLSVFSSAVQGGKCVPKNQLSVSCHNQLRINMRPLTAGCDDLRFCGESTWINSTRFSHHQCWRYLQKAATAWLMMQRAITSSEDDKLCSLLNTAGARKPRNCAEYFAPLDDKCTHSELTSSPSSSDFRQGGFPWVFCVVAVAFYRRCICLPARRNVFVSGGTNLYEPYKIV